MRLLVALGVALLGIAALLGRHTNTLEERLRPLQIRKVALSRWAGYPFDAYQPAGRPILLRLRWTLAMVYVVAAAAVVILLYACPRL